jgi:putative FmdB family regulatory protein
MPEVYMPIYEYVCKECGKDFSVVMRISEHDQGGIKCEHCKGKKVRQKLSGFYVKTSKKS